MFNLQCLHCVNNPLKFANIRLSFHFTHSTHFSHPQSTIHYIYFHLRSCDSFNHIIDVNGKIEMIKKIQLFKSEQKR